MSIVEIAEKFGMKVNPDLDRVDIVLDKLAYIQKETGVRYCPCLPNRDKDTICPCKFMREKHVCRCGLYVPKS